MVRFVIYADRAEDISELTVLLRKAMRERGEWALVQSFIGEGELSHYLDFVEYNPYLVMVIAVYGTRGREIAMRIRKNNPTARMLWFSGADNGIYSYRVHVTCFGLLPATPEGIAAALDSCGIFPAATPHPEGKA